MSKDGEAIIEGIGQSGENRRGLIRAAAGGLVLAASGLVLPGWLEEAKAREGALGGAKGGRRDNDQKGRHRRRTHGNKKDKRKDHNRGDIFYTLPGILVYNERSEPVQLRGLQRQSPHHNWYVPSGWDWAAIPAKAANGDAAVRKFSGNWADMVVQIGTDRVVEFYFDWPVAPDANIYSGGWESNGWNPVGQKLASGRRMPINDSIAAPGITATRITDFDGHVWLKVELT